MTKTLEDCRRDADQLIDRVLSAAGGGIVSGILLGSSATPRELAREALAVALLDAYENGVRVGETKRASRKRKNP